MSEIWLRTLVRILTFRILALAVTAFFVGWNIAIVLQLILIVLHYVIERVWLSVSWGKISPQN